MQTVLLLVVRFVMIPEYCKSSFFLCGCSQRMDGVKHRCEPDNCAICHVVMTANNNLFSNVRPLGKTRLMKNLAELIRIRFRFYWKTKIICTWLLWQFIITQEQWLSWQTVCFWFWLKMLLLLNFKNELCLYGIFQIFTYIQMDSSWIWDELRAEVKTKLPASHMQLLTSRGRCYQSSHFTLSVSVSSNVIRGREDNIFYRYTGISHR